MFRLKRSLVQEEPPAREESVSDRMTPMCYLCGEEHIGIANEATIMLMGQWFPSTEYDTPIFLLNPDTKLMVLQMPNGQFALISDQLGHPSKHAHLECLEALADEPDEDETYEEDEEF